MLAKHKEYISTGHIGRTNNQFTGTIRICNHCDNDATYICSESILWCARCWEAAMTYTVRSAKRKPPIPGPKHWVSGTMYRILKKRFKVCINRKHIWFRWENNKYKQEK